MGTQLRLVTLVQQLLLLRVLLWWLLCAMAALATLQQVLQGGLGRQLWVRFWGVAVACGGGPSPAVNLHCRILWGLLLCQALLLLVQ